jgi:hypothetical protein
MGVLWLSTVPPTNATVAQIFGVQVLSMLGGFVFSATRSAVSGRVAGRQALRPDGSYDVVWWIAVALGVFAAMLVNLPVRESAIIRPAPAAGAAA